MREWMNEMEEETIEAEDENGNDFTYERRAF